MDGWNMLKPCTYWDKPSINWCRSFFDPQYDKPLLIPILWLVFWYPSCSRNYIPWALAGEPRRSTNLHCVEKPSKIGTSWRNLGQLWRWGVSHCHVWFPEGICWLSSRFQGMLMLRKFARPTLAVIGPPQGSGLLPWWHDRQLVAWF